MRAQAAIKNVALLSPRSGLNALRIRMRIRTPPVLAGLRSAGADGLKILDVRRPRSGLVSKISVCPEHRKVPEAKRRDADCGSPFFGLPYFGEAKKGESPAAATERHRNFAERMLTRSEKKSESGVLGVGAQIPRA